MKARPKAHGAPIQCTRGKCSKAFHVSCAKEGGEHGIVFDIVREVEKEVLLIDPAQDASAAVDPATPDGKVVKTTKSSNTSSSAPNTTP